MAPSPLSNLLNFASNRSSHKGSSFLPPAGTQTLVTDTRGSPGLFLLVEFLKAALPPSSSSANALHEQRTRPVVWIACDGSGFNHIKGVTRRLGVNLTQCSSKGLFKYIDASQMMLDEQDGGEAPLHRLHAQAVESVRQLQEQSLGDPLIIVDDVTALLWSIHCDSGMDPTVSASAHAVGRWLTALRKSPSLQAASLVLLQHSEPDLNLDSDSSQLFQRLLRSSHLWLQVKELSSGSARDCSGEISVHPLVGYWGNGDGDYDEVISPASGGVGRGVLYNIAHDGTTVIWARGTQGTS